MQHEEYLKICIELAKKGEQKVRPNPLVGCVIVHQQEIIGSGYHKAFGDNHAEVEAIHNAITKKNLFPKSTMYINLEPCIHEGKVGPCVEKILQYKIPTLVIGMIDPNPLMNGKSVEKLISAGVNVTVLRSEEAVELNKVFLVNIEKKRPFIQLKLAITDDYALTLANGVRSKISCKESDEKVQELRRFHDAILVGANTVRIDNPELASTMSDEKYYPKRIILDPRGTLQHTYKVFQENDNFLHLCNITDNAKKLIKCDLENKGISSLLSELYKDYGIYSILVEGGYKTAELFMDAGVVDELTVIKSTLKSNSAKKIAQNIIKHIQSNECIITNVGEDTWHTLKFYNRSN